MPIYKKRNNQYGYVKESKKEQGAGRGRSRGCVRRRPCGKNIGQCRASDKGEGSERQFAPRIARPGKRRQRGEIKGIARDPAPARRRSVWRMEYTSASRKPPRPKGPDDGRPAGRAQIGKANVCIPGHNASLLFRSPLG